MPAKVLIFIPFTRSSVTAAQADLVMGSLSPRFNAFLTSERKLGSVNVAVTSSESTPACPFSAISSSAVLKAVDSS